jgi:hypothetical protein
MRRAHSTLRLLYPAFLAAALALAGTAADANWLSRLARGAGEVGETAGKAGKVGIPALEGAAGLVAKLPPQAKGAALAAHVTPEGHWTFANRAGEVFTAANSDEMARVAGALAPDLPPGGKLSLYLSEDTVFRERSLLAQLPPNAELHMVVGDAGYPLRRAAGAPEKLVAEVRPNISLEVGDRTLFDEAVFQLSRPLNRSNIRVLALEPGGPKAISSAPRFDPATKTALVDEIDPGSLMGTLGKLKGQTVLVTGRLDGDALIYRPQRGPEQKLFVNELLRSAEAADVNVVILESGMPRQPGGRNWLWQKVEVAGLDDAMQRATFADFLNGLAASGGELNVSAAPGSSGRIVLRAVPSGEAAIPLSDTFAEWMGEVTGHVAVKAVQVHTRDAERERELDARFIPGIPSTVQFTYLVGIAMGVLGLGVARGWWARIWPPEQRQEYGSTIGYHAAKAARLAAFVLLFLPVVGFPAFMWSIVLQLWAGLTAPLRWFGWLRSRLSPRAG